MGTKRSISRAKLSVGFVAALCLAAVATFVGSLLAQSATPNSLDRPSSAASASVTRQEFDDRRQIELAFSQSPGYVLASPRSGRVTALTCQAGTPFRSGSSNVAIDGQSILNLATDVPPWRDLTMGATGEDVRSLQRELTRLGHPVPETGTLGPRTLGAFAEVLRSADPSIGAVEKIKMSRVLWLPGPEIYVDSCSVDRGSTIQAGAALASLPASVLQAKIVRLPDNPMVGERVVEIDGREIPLGADGITVDPSALAYLAATQSYAEASASKATSLNAVYRLRVPVKMTAVPAGAIYNLDGMRGCILGDGEPMRVEVRGSRRGRSFVRFRQSAPSKVALEPKKDASCE